MTAQPDSPNPDNSEPLDPAHLWLRDIYQGDTVRQLSARSLIAGMLIGGIMSISNLYVGLKTGWGLGVTVTSTIIAYAVFKFLEGVVPGWKKDHFTVLENYTMSSAASAAGYISSAGLVSAIPALYMTQGVVLPWWQLMLWTIAISILGVFLAVPLKRQMINIEQLPFPSGIATAETLKSMHADGTEALVKARSLLWSACVGGGLALWRDGLGLMGSIVGWLTRRQGLKEVFSQFSIPAEFGLIPTEFGHSLLKRFTLGFETSLVMVAAGAIMGIRLGVSMLLGTIFYYCCLAPLLIEKGWAQPGYRGIVSWILWPSTAMMVTSGLLSFAMRWRTVLRAFTGLFAMLAPYEGEHKKDPLDDVEVPDSWFLIGTALSGGACVYLGAEFFQIPIWQGILAVVMTFFLSVVAARATGETDITPIGAMGKITQLTFAAVAPRNLTVNLMSASITSGAASHAADLLTDLKSGYLLGGNPRKQLISQLFGVVAGALLCIPVYYVVVKPEKLGSDEMPAPSAQVWAGVAKLLAGEAEKPAVPAADPKEAAPANPGVPAEVKAPRKTGLPDGTIPAMVIGAIVGVILTLCEEFLPKKIVRWIPSPTGLGIAGVIPAFNSISMFLGALIAWLLQKFRPQIHERYTITVSSGLIAGELLMGVSIILLSEGPALIATLFGG